MHQELPFRKKILETQLAIKAVIEAGKAVMEIYESDFSSMLKDNNEPVTEADIKSNEIIQQIISVSDYPILSEETIDNKERLIHNKIWIVDPLDGTADFIKRTDEFTIMIALIENNKPILGVIFWPVNNIMYVAQNTEGAYKFFDDKWLKLETSHVSELERCTATCSRHHLSENDQNFLTKLGITEFSKRGSSLKVTDVCSGKADLYFTLTNKIKQWDTCASYCLIKEAGGKMTDMFGTDLEYNTDTINHQNGILVTNGIIHKQIVQNYIEFLK